MDDEKLLEGFPPLTAEDIRRINGIFTPYIFFSRAWDGGRDCECTSCGEAFHVEGIPRTQTPEWRKFMEARHNGTAQCPKCGRTVTLKNKGICKSGRSLCEWRRVVLLHTRDGNVFAQAGYVRKDHSPHCWRPEAEVLPKAMYLFRPGEAAGWRWRHDWTYLGITPAGHRIREGWERMKTICEPWQSKGYSGRAGYFWNGYHVIGKERLKDSFLRYCAEAFPKWSAVPPVDSGEHDAYIRLLGTAAVHPEIEMLLKMGLKRIVDDLVIGKKKLTKEIRWSEKDPRKAFGLTGPELKDFCAVNGSAELLRRYKLLKKSGIRTDFRELDRISGLIPDGLADRFFRACTAGCGVRPAKALEYVKKAGGKAYVSRDSAIQWMDYVESAKYCGYDLDKPLVLMPRQLKEAHDGAVETELRLRNERETQDDPPFQRRYRKLMDRYGFTDGTFFIRAPSSSREIILEGKALSHCVGRYAGNHAAGRTNILFMRRVKEPFRPAWTIEIREDQMIQVQGNANSGEYKPKGEEEAFLRRWEAWVKAGSKRDKAGDPIEFDMEGAKTA